MCIQLFLDLILDKDKYKLSLEQTPRSDYFPWQYIISLPPARFFAQKQADSFFLNYIFFWTYLLKI